MKKLFLFDFLRFWAFHDCARNGERGTDNLVCTG